MPAYLDHSATTPTLPEVSQRMIDVMRCDFYNPSAAYAPAARVERALDAARDTLRKAAGAAGFRVVFTGSGTESDALAILGTADTLRKPAVLCVSAVEHPAVREAMRVAEARGHIVRVLPVDQRGVLDIAALDSLLDDTVALVSVMHVNNETSAIQPIARLRQRMAALCPKALLHVDGVQGFLRVPLDVGKTGIDLYTVSAHKIHGPKGVGALLIKPGVRLIPQTPGGGQEGGLRSGTENVPGIIGLQAAVETLAALPPWRDALAAKKAALWDRLARGGEGIMVNGPAPGDADSAPHILNVSFGGMRGEVLLHALEAEEIYVSTGSACASRRAKHSDTLAAMGVTGDRLDGAVRFSLSPMTTEQEIADAADAALRAYTQYKGLRRR